MYAGSRTISSSLRPQIDIIKNRIRFTKNKFDGTGYTFKQAIKELRQEGIKIKLDRKSYMYYKN